MNRVTCDILLYAGKWSPRSRRSLSTSLAHAIQGALEVEATNCEDLTGDGPCVQVTVMYCGDSEYIREAIYERLLYYLRPQYDNQVEVEIAYEQPPLFMDSNSIV